jgi:hypothetical protein
LRLPRALIEAPEIAKEVDELVVGEIWYASDNFIHLVLYKVELLKVPRRIEVGIRESSQDDLACSHCGHDERPFRTLQGPSLFGDLPVARMAEHGLVGWCLDLGPPRTSHAARLDVVDLQVSGGTTDLTSGIGTNRHCVSHITITS